MTGTYDYRLVILSILIAVYASYTALDLAGRVTSARATNARTWLFGGAIAMGTGIWSMHFIAMLAFSLPIKVGYDVFITFCSWLMAVLASGLALATVSQANLNPIRLCCAGFIMGIAICGMHYTGMYAMKVDPSLQYRPVLLVASFFIAISVAIVALWVSFHLRDAYSMFGIVRKIGAALLMGIAITGMHYTGMAATEFSDNSLSLAAYAIDSEYLAILISVATFGLLSMTLVVSILDHRLETKTAGLVESLSKANEELRWSGLHDALTALPNRVLLKDRVEHCIRCAERQPRKFALVFIDLDGFKAVNDSLGHSVGDELLKQVARSIESALRKKDTIARVGGDEFVVLIDEILDEGDAAAICKRMLAYIASIKGVGDHKFEISASMGISMYPDDASDFNKLLMYADTAMYYVKKDGKNDFRYFSSDMNETVYQEFDIQSELRRAIREDELVLFFQAQFDVERRSIVGAEALVRWSHPEKGLLPPDTFIPVAKKFGIIHELDFWVLSRTCEYISAWQMSKYKVPPVSVNISALQFRQKNFVDSVRVILEENNVNPDLLIFEITESTAMDNVVQTLKTLGSLQEMGIQVALDDFGTGYSSLSYLGKFLVQKLKIDRSFIKDLGDDNAIIRSIIGLAQAFNLQVVAEGVETEAQFAMLRSLGCHEIQGYLTGRPMPDNDFLSVLEQNRRQLDMDCAV